MWPFKNKTSQEDIISKTFETVICIPGNWNSWDEFILLIVTATNGEYLAAGNILMNVKTKKNYSIEFCERDEKIEKSFRYAGMVTRVTDNSITEIRNHKHVIYISGSTGNLEDAEHIAFAAEAILKLVDLELKWKLQVKRLRKANGIICLKLLRNQTYIKCLLWTQLLTKTEPFILVECKI